MAGHDDAPLWSIELSAVTNLAEALAMVQRLYPSAPDALLAAAMVALIDAHPGAATDTRLQAHRHAMIALAGVEHPLNADKLRLHAAPKGPTQ